MLRHLEMGRNALRCGNLDIVTLSVPKGKGVDIETVLLGDGKRGRRVDPTTQ
jgi:hypothetical protein